MTNQNIENTNTFNNKQVLSLVISTAIIVFTLSGVYFTFNANNVRLDSLESEHAVEMKSLRDEMKLMATFFQAQFDSYKDDAKRRTNTIRDRTDTRLDKLEISDSDKQ